MALPPASYMGLLLLCGVLPVVPLHPTEPPLMPGRPFLTVWNAPIQTCRDLRVPLDTAPFQAVTTPGRGAGQFLNIFYDDQLGLYPKVDLSKRRRFQGGIPQTANLTAHLALARDQIESSVTRDASPGLAVIDWEGWRPLWDQNWGSKRIYQKLSLAHALLMAPFLPRGRVAHLAREQFESAGRRFMLRTLGLGLGRRPGRRWGFYLFPDCYNYGWREAGYTGRCSAAARRQNDRLLWLWERSTALFPSAYIHPSLRDSNNTVLFVRNRVEEALRVAALPRRPYTVPIYVYCRLLYRGQKESFLSLSDLQSSVGESAALGASGVILWGRHSDYSDQASCQSLSEYLSSTLSPYIANVTAAATLCSCMLCQSNGRCVRKRSDSAHYLHLNPAHFHVLRSDGRYVAVGVPSRADLDAWAQDFTCQCFAGRSCSANLTYPSNISLIWV